MNNRIEDTSFISIPVSHSIPHASHDYWDDKVAEAKAKMKELGVQHLLAKHIPKQAPKLRRRISQ